MGSKGGAMRKQVWGYALIPVLSLAANGCVCEVCHSVCATCTVEALFASPSIDHAIEKRLIEILEGAKETILLAMYSFTDDQLGDAVIRAHQGGSAFG